MYVTCCYRFLHLVLLLDLWLLILMIGSYYYLTAEENNE